MRMVFGLAGLLLTLLVIVMILHYAYLPHTQQVVRTGQAARQQVEQVAGVGVHDSYKTDAVTSGGKLDSLLVVSVVSGGAMEKYYGLKLNDAIVAIGPQRVRDIGDEGLARALCDESPGRNWPLIVVRQGQRLVLNPASPKAASPAPAPAPGTPPAPKPSGDPVRDQIDAIKIPVR